MNNAKKEIQRNIIAQDTSVKTKHAHFELGFKFHQPNSCMVHLIYTPKLQV